MPSCLQKLPAAPKSPPALPPDTTRIDEMTAASKNSGRLSKIRQSQSPAEKAGEFEAAFSRSEA
jgi:hypothetical protein